MSNPSVSVMVDKVASTATDTLIREIIAECRRRAELQGTTYRAEHPRAWFLSENVEGAMWAFNSLGRDLCKRHIGHEFIEAQKDWRKECSICGTIESSNAQPVES